MWWLATTSSPARDRDRRLQLRADGQCGARATRNGNAMGSGAYPRERRSSWRRVPVARATESSQRMWISRSWVSRPSTIGPSRVAGVAVVVRDRLVAAVPARHHERAADAGHEQVVERRVGEEHAEVGKARARPHRRWRSRTTPGGVRARSGGAATRARRWRRRRARHTDPATLEIRHHHRERLVVARLAAPELAHRGGVGGVDREVVAADALDRDDRARRGARRSPRRARRRRRRARAPVGVAPRELRPALPGTRWVARGNVGPTDRRTRPGRPRTSRSRAWSWRGGRRERRARSCSAAHSSCSS